MGQSSQRSQWARRRLSEQRASHPPNPPPLAALPTRAGARALPDPRGPLVHPDARADSGRGHPGQAALLPQPALPDDTGGQPTRKRWCCAAAAPLHSRPSRPACLGACSGAFCFPAARPPPLPGRCCTSPSRAASRPSPRRCTRATPSSAASSPSGAATASSAKTTLPRRQTVRAARPPPSAALALALACRPAEPSSVAPPSRAAPLPLLSKPTARALPAVPSRLPRAGTRHAFDPALIYTFEFYEDKFDPACFDLMLIGLRCARPAAAPASACWPCARLGTPRALCVGRRPCWPLSPPTAAVAAAADARPRSAARPLRRAGST